MDNSNSALRSKYQSLVACRYSHICTTHFRLRGMVQGSARGGPLVGRDQERRLLSILPDYAPLKKLSCALSSLIMAQFSLTVEEFKPPTFPQPINIEPSDFRSPLIPSATGTPTSSLDISISLPFARSNKDPLYPATHLQLSFKYEGTGEIFLPAVIMSQDLHCSATVSYLYDIEVLPRSIPRAKVNHGATSTAEVVIYAWKGEKLLGNWTAGCIAELGIVGLKSTEVALLRQKTWKVAQRESTVSK